MSLSPGTRIGPYEVEALLGVGGMGEVYRCRDGRLDRSVAIKLLSPEAVPDPARLSRFLAEAKTVSALNHPNILTVHEIGESDGGPYLVTELVEGTTVRDKLRAGPLPWREALDVALQAATGLAKSHAAGIVHRDIKPENLMVTRDGLVKILDFGLAKLREPGTDALSDSNVTATGMIVGTPAYVAPERLDGIAADERADVFSLGVVLYEMVCGENPFVRGNALSTLHAIQNEAAPPLQQRRADVPPELTAVVARATAKEPAVRYADASELRAALSDVRIRVQSAPNWAAPGSSRAGRRRRWLIPALVVVALVALATWTTRRMDLRHVRDEGGAVSEGPAAGETARSGTSPRFAVQLPEGKLGVAILPISDRAADPELSAAGIGRILTDAFVQILADQPEVYVIAPHRLAGIARSFGHSIADADSDLELARRVAVEAQAGAMLTGTFSRLGMTFILSATLTELPGEVVVDQFRVQSQNVEALLAELSEGVRMRLREKLATDTARNGEPQRPMPTKSIEAYAHYVRGDDLLQEGRWSDAAAELRRAVGLDPEMALAWSSLSCAQSFAGDDVGARAAAAQARRFWDRVNERERRWIELDNIWVETEDGDRYLAGIASYIRDYPDDRDSYFYAGLAEEYLKGNPQAALSWYDKAYWLVPTYYPVVKAIVDCRLKLGQHDEAIRVLERYLAQEHVGEHGRAQAGARLHELRKRS